MSRGIFVKLILDCLDLDIPLIPLESPYDFLKRKNQINRKQYRETISKLKNRGVIKIIKAKNKEFLQLTRKGKLKALLEKANVKPVEVWDRKWRLLTFDIPEDFHLERDRFRALLKTHYFVKLQASVFISPYSLNRNAIEYLNQTGIIRYVRIMRVDEMDNDKDLRKKFKL